MTSRSNFLGLVFCIFFVGCLSIGHAQSSTANAASSPAIVPNPSFSGFDSTTREANQLLIQGKLDEGLAKINPVLQSDPKNADALVVRGNIYSRKKNYDLAKADYTAFLQLVPQDPKATIVRFNLAELSFLQKKYDEARPGFDAIKTHEDWGDLAIYKVFLCDLLGGHEDVANKELDAFNQVGSKASYYFANAAWNLVHHKPDEARVWLLSIGRIYAPEKIELYSSSLKELGYLPLPAPPSAAQ